jgi:hypothetical protein
MAVTTSTFEGTVTRIDQQEGPVGEYWVSVLATPANKDGTTGFGNQSEIFCFKMASGLPAVGDLVDITIAAS